jgi:hypothetical protein
VRNGKRFRPEGGPDLGRGWKTNPYVVIKPHEVFEIAGIEGPGAVQHIWMTPTGKWRSSINNNNSSIRFYRDNEDTQEQAPGYLRWNVPWGIFSVPAGSATTRSLRWPYA